MKVLKIVLFIILLLILSHFIIMAILEPEEVDLPDRYHYSYKDYTEIDSFSDADGFMAYLPQDYKADSIPLIVFNHGWGAHNPLAYGAWIRHLVYQGYAVIFPRYQCSVLTPPKDFTENTAIGIRAGIKAIHEIAGISPKLDQYIIFGHSFGGVISVNLATEWEKFKIPKPSAVFAMQPGHGPMESGRVEDYSKFPEDIKLILLSSEKDHVTGDDFSKEIYTLNKERVNDIFWLKMFYDKNADETVKAVHEDPLAMDPEFDKNTAFLILARAKMIHKLDHADYYGFWKIGDEIAQCIFSDIDCDIPFGKTEMERFMGNWKDGSPVKSIQVMQ